MFKLIIAAMFALVIWFFAASYIIVPGTYIFMIVSVFLVLGIFAGRYLKSSRKINDK